MSIRNTEGSFQPSEPERERLTKTPNVSEFQRLKLDREAKKNWDLFYKRNGDRFFKNRYWTRHEFQELFSGAQAQSDGDAGHSQVEEMKYLLEIGCGCGDFVLPLLGEDDLCDKSRAKDLFIYCCDISNVAIELLKSNPIYIRHQEPARIKAFVADITEKNDADKMLTLTRLDRNLMDIVSLVFVLSALEPTKMRAAIENLYKVVKPGGLILFRDYAINDQAMLRFSENSKICDQFYVRQDGTRAYFFTKEELLKLFVDCRFQCQSIDYIKRETVNNASRNKFSRIFLQAKFSKEI